MLPLMPESPKYMVINKGREEAGRSALRSLRSSVSEADSEVDEYVRTRESTYRESQMDGGVSIIKLLVSVRFSCTAEKLAIISISHLFKDQVTNPFLLRKLCLNN